MVSHKFMSPLDPTTPRGGRISPTARRQPIQGRSQDKVQRILAATAQLADTMPVDAITMATIAEAAGASFSSIYRFFPSKEAIIEAVVIASLNRLQGLYANFFSGPGPESGAEVIDGAIDLYVGFVEQEPGFKALWLGAPDTPEMSSRLRRVTEGSLHMAKLYALEPLGIPASPELELRLGIAAAATMQVLRYAFQQTDHPPEKVVAELKRWLRAALLMLG
jgi:AcrR family transcriptional regulator